MGSNFQSNGQQAPEGMQAYAAPSLFQPHRTRQAIRDAYEKKIPPLMGYYAGLSSVPITRFLAPMGYDAVWIDWEHTSCNVETMTTMVHETMFMSGGRSIPWVRVPGHDHAAIGYALDAGASLVIPQVETVAQAKHVMSSAKFGTKQNGTRSAPPFRLVPGLTDMAYDGKRDVWQNLNDQAAVMIQIESLEGINNLDAILTECPDIDLVWLGSLDCRISMNLPANGGMGGTEPEWLAAVAKFEATLKKHNKPRGGFSFAQGDALRAASEGYAFMLIAADVAKLGEMGQQLADARAVFAN
ncbi:Pyruvate/Phosphoenolpyruvate kinase-like domain-containing protein [Diplogelasinospora grovesii]|uniref:Pyruvate/Phosphoenolpyruvate kinase-like domain-containing protein n=1 Tax=Diplogelasinospora grovesii TaxID=303347 RepID=A0AAN6N372_9PEZI|nr:Pyruvate/Phosphoenolpyruvate kinase-like domain-containing protein [Diplogelasinospora grovesii]